MSSEIALWDEGKVSEWLRSVNLEEFCDTFVVNDVTGSVLLMLDHSALKEMNISSVGKRLIILNAINKLMIDYHIQEDELPPRISTEKDEVIQELQSQISEMKKNLDQSKLDSKTKKKSIILTVSEKFKKEPKKSKFGDKGTIRIYGNSLRESDNYKTFAVTIVETCRSVLEKALVKFGIYDKWEKFTLFLHFKGKERSLRYDEIPLYLKIHLQDKEEEPTFSIRNIRQFEDSNKSEIDRQSIASKREMLKKNMEDTKLEKNGEESDNAVAIYEYLAALEDELSIQIGDKVKVLNRATGWWYVEKDGMTGWTPSSCLDVVIQNESSDNDEDFPKMGKILYDYVAEGANELTILKGEIVTVHQSHQHWYLADNSKGIQGWIPSCYISLDNEGEGNMKMRPAANPPALLPSSEADNEMDDISSEKELAEFNELFKKAKTNKDINNVIDTITEFSDSSDSDLEPDGNYQRKIQDTINKLCSAVEKLPDKSPIKEHVKQIMESINDDFQRISNSKKTDFEDITKRITKLLNDLDSVKLK